MPELPEVETVMRGLIPHLSGKIIRRAIVSRPALRWPIPPMLSSVLTGARVVGFRRRGKYILIRLDNGQSVLLHLGMSGRIAICTDGQPDIRPHEHLIIETEAGARIALIDPRRFGCLDLMPTKAEDRHKLIAPMGPEPLEDAFTAATLRAAFKGKKTPIKSALLDQSIVVGLGNIYVCEALYRSGVSPERLAGTLTIDECARLTADIKSVLSEAIAAGGSSLRDYAQPDGQLGYFQHAWRVYGREGEACSACVEKSGGEGVIRRITQSGRSTFFCPTCQPIKDSLQ